MLPPKDWIKYSLGDVVSFKNGLNFTRADRGQAIKIVGVGDFRARSELSSTSALETVRVAGIIRTDELLAPGDLLFVRSNGNKALIGRCLFFPEVNEPLAFSGFTIRGRVNKDVLVPRFASYLMRSSVVTAQFYQNGGGTNINNLSQEILGAVFIRVPSLGEQRKIAAALSVWDQAIATTERLLANSRKQKQMLLRDLLEKRKRLPGNTSNWKKWKLGDLFAERAEMGRIDLPLISITRDEGVIRRSDVGRKDTSSEDKSKYLRIVPGDIGYNTMRMWQGVSALSSLEGIVSPAYTILIPNEKIDARFAAYLFKYERMISDFCRHSQGLVSDTWNLKFPHFARIEVNIPRIAEQKQIADVLHTVDKSIGVLLRKIGCLRNEKRALMSALFTGKRRFHVAELESEAIA